MAEPGAAPTELEMPQPLKYLSGGEPAEEARAGKAVRLEAFTRVVDHFKDPLIGYLFRLVGDRERAEDLAQETFLRLYQRGHKYEERGQLKAYLFRIATNLVRSEARRAFRWDRVRSLLPLSRGDAPAQERQLMQRELRVELTRAIAALPLRYRAPLVLREVDGWAYREISQSLKCSEGTVKSRIHRGRKLLRRQLAAYWEGISK